MKLVVLVDNHTLIDQYYCGEPAVSYWLEDGDSRVLFDTGYSDLLIRNAKTMGLDLERLDAIVLSHGHNDHSRGLQYLLKQYDLSRVKLVAHPLAFDEKWDDDLPIGSPVSRAVLDKKCQLVLSKEPLRVSPHLYFLGEIPQYNQFESRQALGHCRLEGAVTEDYVVDDSALVYQSEKGIYIISGCAHSGICNIVEHAKKVTGDTRVMGILGGFHLFEVNPRLHQTINYFVDNQIQALYPCHCVSFAAKAEIHKTLPIHEVGVGLVVKW